MKNQVVAVLAASLALAGCGGGGSSGGGSSDPGDSVKALTTADLVGTWVRTNVNYADPYASGALEWVKTRRQTIIVEKVSGVFRFRDCISGAILSANLVNKTVTFPAQPGLSLSVVDANTITARILLPGAETNVELRKASSNTETVLADINLDVDFGGSVVEQSEWDQVCVETIVDKYLSDTVELKAVGSEGVLSGTVKMKFETASAFTPGQYDYPGAGNNITGSYTVSLLGSGNLSDPTGTMVVIDGDTRDFYVSDIVMSNTGSPDSIGVDGLVKFNPEWFAGE